jgi:signal transduction histidine kinase
MRWPIRHQILLPFAVMTLFVVMAAGLCSAYLAARRVERRIELQVRNLGRTLLESSFPLTDAVLEQMNGLSGAHFVFVDDAGGIVATSRPTAPLWQSRTPPVNDWRMLRLGPLVKFNSEGYFASALRIEGQRPGRQAGVLHMLYPESQWSSDRREAAMPPLAGGFATLCICVLLSAIIARRISRPIARLQHQVLRLANGDFTSLPLPARNDELRDLAGSVNVLAEQLSQMRRAIRRTERLTLLGRLSGALAHHLRNDITGTRMAVQLHQRHCTGNDVESLAVALRQLEITEQHLQRLLAAGQPREPSRSDCDLEEIAEHIVRLVEPACMHRRLAISLLRIGASEGQHGGFGMAADAEQLRHLLMNLVVNAMEAVEAGGSVRIEIERTNVALVLRVLDSGPGPPAWVADQLFEEFITSKPEGVGLGLAVARRIAESHGGTLTYTRRDGCTCFELCLPLPCETPSPGARGGIMNREEVAWLSC